MKSKQTKWTDVEGRFNLAGVMYSDYGLICGKQGIKAGSILQLIWERKNKYDPLAIAVKYKGIRIGYVPRYSIHQSECHRIHAKGHKLIAVLTAFNKNNPSWCMITVQIKTTEKPIAESSDVDMGKGK